MYGPREKGGIPSPKGQGMYGMMPARSGGVYGRCGVATVCESEAACVRASVYVCERRARVGRQREGGVG